MNSIPDTATGHFVDSSELGKEGLSALVHRALELWRGLHRVNIQAAVLQPCFLILATH